MQAEIITNHEVADTLDSSFAFEGPEKTLRIHFTASSSFDGSDGQGLLKVPREEWQKMLDLVKCKVLSVLIHPNVHAYVLSESSLFVHPQHIVLKTCGTTTLLAGVAAIIEIAEKYAGSTYISSQVTSCFYSRRSYFNPEKQEHPHGCWDDEVSRLKSIFKGPAFASHFGIKRDERWHLFTHQTYPPRNTTSGFWLELMMTGLDHELASRFHLDLNTDIGELNVEDSVLSLDSTNSVASAVGAEPDDDDPGHRKGNIMTRTTRIDQLFDSDRQCIDSFAFTPCGYSCNGVLLDTGDYFTIHVTPERGFSYASFETNVKDLDSIETGLNYHTLVERALGLFEPEKLTLAICQPKEQKLIDTDALYDGKYSCTSEACMDLGSSHVTQLSFQKLSN